MPAITLPPVPNPPLPSVSRFDSAGRPTEAQVTYETALKVFLKAVKRLLEST